MIYKFETNRLILREWQDSDIDEFIKLNHDPGVMKYFPKILSPEETLELFKKIRNKFVAQGFGRYAVELKSNHKFIGFIGLEVQNFKANFTPCVEIGWRLSKNYWGNGFAVEGAKKCLEIGFVQFNLCEIVAFAAQANHSSVRVMQKLGMKHDAKNDFRHTLLPHEHYLSKHVLYRINKKSFIDSMLNI